MVETLIMGFSFFTAKLLGVPIFTIPLAFKCLLSVPCSAKARPQCRH